MALLAVLVIACAPYTARTVDLLPRLSAGDYEGALRTLEQTRRSSDELLYALQKGLVLHETGRWEESNASFEAAERMADALYTRSISRVVASFIANDTTVPYYPDPFEMAMVPYYRALNYIYLDQPAEALVEARKASEYLERYVDFAGKAFEGEPSWSGARSRLNNNAFLQYFSGLLYDWAGETNNAFIAYRNAADAYALSGEVLNVHAPKSLGHDLMRTGLRLGFADELAQLAARHPQLLPDEGPDETAVGMEAEDVGSYGEVVVLLEVGAVPQKIQHEVNLPLLESDDYDDYDAWAVDVGARRAAGWHPAGDIEIDYWLRVAFPQLVSSRTSMGSARVAAGDTGSAAQAVVAEDLEGRAFVTFDAKQPKIFMKAIVRALIKYSAKERAEHESEAAGYLVNLLGAAVEKADTRSWTTLPGHIAVARMQLPAGTHDLRVELPAQGGVTPGVERIPGVVVRAGDWTFVAYRVY